MKNSRLAAALLVAAALAVPAFVVLPAPAAAQGAEADALRAVLLESKEKSRGVISGSDVPQSGQA